MIFKRVEKKYLVNEEQKNALFAIIADKLVPDQYGRSTVCSLYLDTPDYLLIRNSIDAKAYKEKLRIRNYGTPKNDSSVFFEIKKKYKGIVYKRRVLMTLDEAFEYALDSFGNIGDDELGTILLVSDGNGDIDSEYAQIIKDKK